MISKFGEMSAMISKFGEMSLDDKKTKDPK